MPAFTGREVREQPRKAEAQGFEHGCLADAVDADQQRERGIEVELRLLEGAKVGVTEAVKFHVASGMSI